MMNEMEINFRIFNRLDEHLKTWEQKEIKNNVMVIMELLQQLYRNESSSWLVGAFVTLRCGVTFLCTRKKLIIE